MSNTLTNRDSELITCLARAVRYAASETEVMPPEHAPTRLTSGLPVIARTTSIASSVAVR